MSENHSNSEAELINFPSSDTGRLVFVSEREREKKAEFQLFRWYQSEYINTAAVSQIQLEGIFALSVCAHKKREREWNLVEVSEIGRLPHCVIGL